ncbi:hypothetical protein Y032_0019g3817 [Ancylostoma ceylanicum]|uniref:Uncharacterized protein n=1 Tax=Ancylostoma ceylanicum TaxID=53326 RepID=A0A016V3X2_9BILA|nr:hypothetical protein Y032_0019g3817 [Ancylostoma ceylanicum]
MLDYHNASPLTILFYYNAATAELAHAYTLHQALTNNLRRLCSSEPPSSEPDVPHIPPIQSPQSNTWTSAITVSTKTNTSLVLSSSTVATATQELHTLNQSAHADAAPASQPPASTPHSIPTAVAVSPIETAPAVPSASFTTDSDALLSENPHVSPDLPKISHRFLLPASAQYAEQQYRKALASQAVAQRAEASSSASTSSAASNVPPTSLPVTSQGSATPREGFHGCFFCSGNHYTASCDAVKSLTDRCYIAANAGRCLRCLYLHPPGQCLREKHCSICGDRDHHPAFCFRNRRSVINDVAENLLSFYKRMCNFAVVKYEDLYMTSRLQ